MSGPSQHQQTKGTAVSKQHDNKKSQGHLETITIVVQGLNEKGLDKVNGKGIEHKRRSKTRSQITGNDLPTVVITIDLSQTNFDAVVAQLVKELTPYGTSEGEVAKRVKRGGPAH